MEIQCGLRKHAFAGPPEASWKNDEAARAICAENANEREGQFHFPKESKRI
jgi:hypothetical protein